MPGRGTDGSSSRAGGATSNRGGAPEDRRVVDAAARGRRRARLVHRLLDVGGLPERTLLCRAVPVAVLFAVSVPVVPAPVVHLRLARHPSAGDRRPVAGVPDPGGAGRLPPDLLLLPQ